MKILILLIKILLSSPFMIVKIDGKKYKHFNSVRLFLWCAVLVPILYIILKKIL